MSESRFVLHRSPTPQQQRWLAERYPANPFCTAAYARAKCTSDQQVLAMLVVRDEHGEPCDGCYGFLMVGRLGLRRMEVPSTPPCVDATTFWAGIRALGTREGIAELLLNSFDSVDFKPPDLDPARVLFRDRTEFVLGLDEGDLITRFSSNHKRNIKRAQKLDFRVEESRSPKAVLEHARLVDLATGRRVSRGSGETAGFSTRTPRALIEAGAASLYQLYDDASMLSSILVLKSATGAYYHSAGTDPQGMRQGASHFLILSVAQSLQAAGIERFNLGGVSAEQEGLRRFKTGFRPTEYPLRSATLYYSGGLRRKLLGAATRIRATQVALVHSLLGKSRSRS